MAELEQRHCRYTSTHDAHEITREGKTFMCPGNEHVPHDQRCCRQHQTHSMPHIGCILR